MLENIKSFFNKYSAQILIVLGALISFTTALETLGGEAAIACVVIVSILELIVYYIQHGLTDTFFSMLVAAIQLITQIVNGEYSQDELVSEVKRDSFKGKSSYKHVNCKLTKEEIAEKLIELMEDK